MGTEGEKQRKGIADRPRHFCARPHRLRFCGRSFLYFNCSFLTIDILPIHHPSHTPWTLNPNSSFPSSMTPTRRSSTRSCKTSPRSRPSSRVSIPQGRGKNGDSLSSLQWAPANPLLLSTVVHQLNDTCWKKCVTGKISSGSLSKSEETCAQNCVERWMDTQVSILKQLETMRAH